MKPHFTALALALVITGCSDQQTANQSNFRDAVQAYLDVMHPVCYLTDNFPATGDRQLFRRASAMAAFVKAGLVAEQELTPQARADLFPNQQALPKTYFTLTDEGRKHYRAKAWRAGDGVDEGGFCFGKARVREIVNFTQPADAFGRTHSKVIFLYSVGDIPTWARSPALISALPDLKEHVGSESSPIRRSATLVLTHKGWVHGDLFNR